VNQYGVKDYFTWDRRNTRTVSTNRNTYTKPVGSWSDTSFTISQHGVGKTVFNSTSTSRMTLSSNWMTDEVSKWLQEAFQSSSVMIYVDEQWEPCVITTANYEQKTYARNRLFQHNIEVEFANNQKIQRG
jgi:hypothetical protein